MNKTIYIGIGVVIVVGIAFGGVYAWNNLRGVGPAIYSSPDDIVDIIDDASTNVEEDPILPAENDTDFPLVLPDGFSISIFSSTL